MKTSPEGVALIKRFEGCRLAAYLCPEGVPTIGYGVTEGVRLGMTITAEEAEAMLVKTLASYEAAVEHAVKVALTQSQFDALVSWSYNVGVGWLGIGGHKPATFIRKLNGGDYGAVPAGLKQFSRGQSGKVYDGLVRRRAAEAALWLKDGDTDAEPPPMPQAVKPAPAGAQAAQRVKESWTLTGALAAIGGVVVQAYQTVVDTLTHAAAEMAGLTSALAGVGLDAKRLGFALLGIGIAVVIARQFQPRSGGSA